MIWVEQSIKLFISTTATNPTTLYNSTTAYSIGDIVRVATKTYKSTLDDNIGNYPLDFLGLYWIEWGSANDYAMLDPLDDTSTKFTGSGVVVFLRGSIEAIGIGNFTATEIVLEYLDNSDNVLDTKTYQYTSYRNMTNEYFYGYGGFETNTTANVLYQELKRLGTKIRVTFNNGGSDTSCGFLQAGKVTNLGCTLDGVELLEVQQGRVFAREATFTTIEDKTKFTYNLSLAKDVKANATPLMVVIDPSEKSSHNNMVILGTVKDYRGTGENAEKNKISWTIQQNIQE